MNTRKIPRIYFENCYSAKESVNGCLRNILGYIPKDKNPNKFINLIKVDLKDTITLEIEEDVLKNMLMKFRKNDDQYVSLLLGVSLILGGQE